MICDDKSYITGQHGSVMTTLTSQDSMICDDKAYITGQHDS